MPYCASQSDALPTTPVAEPFDFAHMLHSLTPAEDYEVMRTVVSNYIASPPAAPRLGRTLNVHQISRAAYAIAYGLQSDEYPYFLAHTHISDEFGTTLMYYYFHTNGHSYFINFRDVISVDSIVYVNRNYL